MKTMTKGLFCGMGGRVMLLPLGMTALLLAGCSSGNERLAMAKPPPIFIPDAEREPITRIGVQGRHEGVFQDYVGKIEPAAGETFRPGFNNADAQLSRCTLSSSFSQGEPVAYEWGRNRVGLGVNAERYDIGFARSTSAEATLRYSFSLSSSPVSKARNCLID